MHVVIHQGSAGAAKYSFTAGLPQPTIRKPWADVRSIPPPGNPGSRHYSISKNQPWSRRRWFAAGTRTGSVSRSSPVRQRRKKRFPIIERAPSTPQDEYARNWMAVLTNSRIERKGAVIHVESRRASALLLTKG